MVDQAGLGSGWGDRCQNLRADLGRLRVVLGSAGMHGARGGDLAIEAATPEDWHHLRGHLGDVAVQRQGFADRSEGSVDDALRRPAVTSSTQSILSQEVIDPGELPLVDGPMDWALRCCLTRC